MKIQARQHLLNFHKMSYINEDEENEVDIENVIDCSLGTNPFGCSKLIDDDIKLLKTINISNYPEYPYIKLRRKISEYWSDVVDISSNNIRLGNGSMVIMSKINKIFIDTNSLVLGYCPQFTQYITDVRSYGGKYEYVELKNNNNYKFSYQDILNMMTKDHQIIYIDNPNNPTGQVIPISELSVIIEKAEKMNICVIIDEAYGDFMKKENSAINLVKKFSNLFVVRTFSKGFGLAGIRIGYVVCSDQLLEYYQKVNMPFDVNNFGHTIVQMALKDNKFIDESINKIKDLKGRLINSLSKIKVLETDLGVPIMVLEHPDKDVDLHEVFLKHKVLTESGKDFVGLGKNFVRLRINEKTEELIQIVKNIEQNN